MKKIFKGLVAGVLGFAVFTAGGCLYSYENPPDNQNPSLYGFKVCYSDNNYVLDNTFQTFSNHILSELFATFAVPSSSVYQSGQNALPLSNNSKNYDRIRVQENTSGVIVSEGWNWTFATTFSAVESQANAQDVVTYYADALRQTAYLTEFLNLYSIPLQVAAIQIAMGQTPQTYTIVVDETKKSTQVFTTSQKTTLADNAFLESIKAQFASSGEYVGFTQENTVTFKNYLLSEVIGANIIGTQFDKVFMQSGQTTYSALIDAILGTSVGTEKDFYSPYPAAKVLDVTDSAFYPSTQNENQLGHIAAKEYQSFTLMPKKNTFVSSITMSFEAQMEISLTLTATLTTQNAKTTLCSYPVTIQPGQFQNQDMLIFFFEQDANLSDFENNFMSANEEVAISNSSGTAKYYDYTPTGAVLNSTLSTQNYLTISFVQQKPNGEYRPFKWAINAMMIGD